MQRGKINHIEVLLLSSSLSCSVPVKLLPSSPIANVDYEDIYSLLPTSLPFFSGTVTKVQISRRKDCRRHLCLREAGIEATETKEMMSILGVSRQSPLGSDFQKVGMTAVTGMGCGEGPQLPGNGELGEQICCVCMSVSL